DVRMLVHRIARAGVDRRQRREPERRHVEPARSRLRNVVERARHTSTRPASVLVHDLARPEDSDVHAREHAIVSMSKLAPIRATYCFDIETMNLDDTVAFVSV